MFRVQYFLNLKQPISWETRIQIKKCFSGKFKKQHSYQYESLMEAVLISIENLPENLKSRYKELAVFHDDVGIPQSVYFFSFRLLGNLYISWYFLKGLYYLAIYLDDSSK